MKIMFLRRISLVGTAVAVIAVGGLGYWVRAQRATRLVEEVAVIGNRRLSKEEILKHVKTKPGEVYSWKQVQRDFQSILALGLFDRVQTRVLQDSGLRGGVVITFEVVEMPLILDVSFEGLRGIKEAELIEAFRREHVNVEKDAVYDPVEVRKAIHVIRNFLMTRGWPNPLVTVLQENVTATSVSLTFVIRRGVGFKDVLYG
jgi:outer membrane protein assembly factor BamA